MNGATITVWWGRGNEVEASIRLTARNWARVKAGKPLYLRGQGYWYEVRRFQDDWYFAGGELEVIYNNDGTGSIAKLSDARIVEEE